MQNFTYFLLSQQGGQGGGMFNLVFIVGMIVVFWLFMIRPQAKRAKQQKQFSESLEKGAKVVTLSGIHGTINKINEDNTISLEISPGTSVKLERSAISLELSKIYSVANPANQKVISNKK